MPSISIIIPTYNESERIRDCLDSIRRQNYPEDRIEILVVDDYSMDDTVEIAKKYSVKVLYNGSRNIERGKSIGLQNAQGELILLMDADNVLVSSECIPKAVEAFACHPDLVGAQMVWFEYDQEDYILNRYCALFGVNDPLAFYLHKRGFLMHTESEWIIPETLVDETDGYFLVHYSIDNLPTLGSQGYMTKRELLLQVDYKPYLFHMDSIYELVEKGHTKFAMMKFEVGHKYVSTVAGFYRKLKRNLDLFLLLRNRRKYTWKTNRMRFALAVLSMVTVVRPLYDSLKGYIKKPDIAWLLHPFFCLTVPVMYAFIVIKWKLLSLLK